MIKYFNKQILKTAAATIMMKEHHHYLKTSRIAGKKRQYILTAALANSTRAFFKKLEGKAIKRALVIGCGTGNTTFQLAEILGADCQVTGLDMNEENIQIANKKLTHNIASCITFQYQNLLEWESDQNYDLIYTQLHINQLSDPQSILQVIYKHLRPMGLLMVEEYNFSNTYCFPQCYAFDRYKELFTKIKKRQGINTNIGSQLPSLFRQSNFNNIEVQMARPLFLSGEYKQIASLTLNNIAPLLFEENLITTAELQILMTELQTFEAQKNTAISLPGIYQVLGCRSKKSFYPIQFLKTISSSI